MVVGLVRGVHGLKGEVRVEALTDRAADRFAPGRELFREGDTAALTIVDAVPDGQGWRVRFAEVADRTAADGLRGAYLEAAVGPSERLPRGEYYWHEVIGAGVADVDGTPLGTVADIYRAGGAEVLLVKGPRGELDVPVVRSIVRIFAPKRGEIVVDGEALGLRGTETSSADGARAAGDDGSGAAGDDGSGAAGDGPRDPAGAGSASDASGG